MISTHKNYFITILCFALTLLSALILACSSQNPNLLEESALNAPRKEIDRGPFPFQGETLRFKARHVNSKMQIAQAEITVSAPKKLDDDNDVIPINGFAKSTSLIRLIAQIDDSFEAYINPKTWQTIYAYLFLNENNKKREFRVWFWNNERKATIERTYKGYEATRETILPFNTQHTVVWIYMLRSLELKENTTMTSFTFDGWILNKLTIKVIDSEEIWTPMGFYDCWKIAIDRERNEISQPYGALSGILIDPEISVEKPKYRIAHAWLAKDKYHTPVRLAVQTGLGEFDILLDEHIPPKY